MLVEKPLTADLAQAEELVAIAERTGTMLQVGHIERFNPAFEAVLRLPLQTEIHHKRTLQWLFRPFDRRRRGVRSDDP